MTTKEIKKEKICKKKEKYTKKKYVFDKKKNTAR